MQCGRDRCTWSPLKDILVVQEFHELFPKRIPGMLPPKEVKFCIDLISGATPNLQSAL